MIVRPQYYDDFECIADRCSFTCCRDWRIAVDDDTYSKWSREYRAKVSDGAIILDKDGKCPFLDEKGLCRIVLKEGEEAISQTCHTFPRENHIFETRTEQTLAMGCPEAVDSLWKLQRWEVVGAEKYDTDTTEGLMFYLRDRILALMGDEQVAIETALKTAFYIALDFYDYQVENNEPDREYVDKLFDKSNVEEIVKAINGVQRNYSDHIYEQNELLMDIMENYRRKGIYSDIIEPIATAAGLYEQDEYEAEFLEGRKTFENEWNKLQNEIRLLMQEEIFSSLYLPEGDIYTIVLKLQWLGITYAALKQMMFLVWKKNGCLEYTIRRKLVCVLIRMTGYSEGDIEEYLENSFEEIIWDWGYMGLIV